MQKLVIRIVKVFSSPGGWPVSWLELECGHTCRAVLNTGATGFGAEHVDENHTLKPGMLGECEACDRYAHALEKLRTLERNAFSHARFRHHDSRGFGPGAYYVYLRDPASPTRVRLGFTIDGTKEAGDLLSKVGLSPISPTEKR